MLISHKKTKSDLTRTRKKRSPITLTSNEDMIKTRHFNDSLPLVIEPNVEGVSLAKWVGASYDWIQKMLNIHGALLFRGFDLHDEKAFSEVMSALPSEPLKYMESSTPRHSVVDNIYTSTDYPTEESIALHNELSTAATFPLKVWFFCHTKPGKNGQTPIGDARALYKRIDPEIRTTFEEKGWSLVRNYADTFGMGINWRVAFKTENRADVETYCRDNAIEFKWNDDKTLWTRQVRPVAITHPLTGETAWFNHMAFWHPANLCDHVREEMLHQFGKNGLPYYTYYGDGSPIPDEIANHIRDCYLAEKVLFDWEKGDLIVLDNISTLHGRQPYEGDRTILVSMNEPFTRTDL